MAMRHCWPSGGVICDADAADAFGAVDGGRVGGAEVEAADDGVGALGEDLGFGEGGAVAVGFEAAGEADALGVVAAVAGGGAAGGCEGGDEALGGEAVRG